MSSAKILYSAFLSAGLLTLSAAASAQSKAAPAPELPAPSTPSTSAPSPDDPAGDTDAPLTHDLESDRGAMPKAPPGWGAPPQPPPSSPMVTPRPSVAAEEPAPEPAPQGPPHKQRFSVGIGFRGANVSDPGYDPYSANDTLPMASVFASFAPWPTRPVQIALAGEWDFGGADATTRGNPTSIVMNRVALGLESRYMPITRMAFFARVIPAAIHVGGTIDDPYLGNKLEASAWTWGVDVTGGAAARVGAVGTNENPLVSFWIALDMGYRFAGTTSMRFRPGDLTEEDQTRRFGEVPLPDLDLSGFIGRLSFSLSF